MVATTAAAAVRKPTDDEIQDMMNGLTFALLAITDDKEKTLEEVAKNNPWHVEALKLIASSRRTSSGGGGIDLEKEPYKPLTSILSDVVDLKLDKHIDERRVSKGMHVIDTQGYVAHNDEVVVLSYRCTTSTFDWLTNFQTTSSAWEPEVDIPHGYSGVCSDFEGLACCGWFGGLAGGMARNTGKARVHTGFYNNFLATVPDIQQYVEPLLGPDQPPRTLYVVGHSLGAGVATLASCYFLLEHDWSKLPQSFRSVTAGSPRACGSLMAEDVEKRIAELALDPSSDVKVYRLVNGTDVVASVPPRQFGFKHVAGAVKINGDDGTIEMPAMKDRSAAGAGDGGSEENESSKDVSEGELNEIVHDSEKVRGEAAPAAEGRASQTDYEKLVSKVPKPLRDHMPDFYLRPIMRARGITLPQMAFGGGGS